MPTQSFQYSPFVGLLGALFFGGMLIFVFFLGTSVPEFDDWMYLLPLILFSVIFLAYFYYKFLAPVLNGKIALELDEEKLNFLITNRVIYWKNVSDIRLENYANSKAIYFKMLDGGKDIAISLRWIRGHNIDIFNSVVAYYNNLQL